MWALPFVAGFTPTTRCFAPHIRGLRRTAGAFMPEGPECTIHAERLHAACSGSRIVRADILSGRYSGSGQVAGRGSPPERWSMLQDALPLTIDSVHSKGKFIYWLLESPTISLWSTLGMTGAWSLMPSEHARLRLVLSSTGALDEEWPLYYNDQRNFGTITVCDDPAMLEDKLSSLGPSWLAPSGLGLDAFRELAGRQCASKRSRAVPLARWLMDQGKTSGIGNYILSESLYLARLYPWACCGDLADEDWVALHAAITDVIARSYHSQNALADSQAAAAEGSVAPAASSAGQGQGQGQRMASSAGQGQVRSRTLSSTRGTTYTFELHVFRRTSTADGLAVRQDEGPHKRSVHWVPERQVRARVDQT